MKRAVSMPCTEQQWLNEVKPLCDKYGLEYTDINSFNTYRYLSNNFNGKDGIISNIFELSILDYNRKEIPYNPIEFIKACGVEVEQPKWEKLTRGGRVEVKEVVQIGKRLAVYGIHYDINLPNDNSQYWICDLEGINTGGNHQYDLIPYNPRKNELLTKKAELEKQLEEINKELEL